MNDITMCKNNDCKDRQKCYRYTAMPSSYQSYADFKPRKDGECDSYYPVKDVQSLSNGEW